MTIKQTVEQNAGLKNLLDNAFYTKLTLLMNRTKGSTHEKMAWAIVLKNAIELLDIEEPQLLLDRKSFICYKENKKIRRCDLYLEQAEIAYEIKSYRPSLSAFVREQIKKDKWLLENKSVKQIWWLLFHGATTSVLMELTKSGIIYINVKATDDAITNVLQIYR